MADSAIDQNPFVKWTQTALTGWAAVESAKRPAAMPAQPDNANAGSTTKRPVVAYGGTDAADINNQAMGTVSVAGLSVNKAILGATALTLLGLFAYKVVK